MLTHNSPQQDVELIDLTRLLGENLSVYSAGDYADPPFQMEMWCTVQSQGFAVARLSLGTQTGTHIDAPCHFIEGAADLEALPIQALMGRYFWLDIGQTTPDRRLPVYRGEPILFLTSSTQTGVEMSEAALIALLDLPCRVWLTVFGVCISDGEPHGFHKALSQAGKYLIEDVDETMAMRVKPGGEIIALPLRLSHASGAPCRVVVRQ